MLFAAPDLDASDDAERAEQADHAVGQLARDRSVLEDHRRSAGDRDHEPSPVHRPPQQGTSLVLGRRPREIGDPCVYAVRPAPSTCSNHEASSRDEMLTWSAVARRRTVTLTPSERHRSATLAARWSSAVGWNDQQTRAASVRRDVTLGEEQADDLPHVLVEGDVHRDVRAVRRRPQQLAPRWQPAGAPPRRGAACLIGGSRTSARRQHRIGGSWPSPADRRRGEGSRCATPGPAGSMASSSVEPVAAASSASGSPSAIGSQSSVVTSAATPRCCVPARLAWRSLGDRPSRSAGDPSSCAR